MSSARTAGIKEASINIAKAMLKKGIDMHTISEITNLSMDEVKELNKKRKIKVESV